MQVKRGYILTLIAIIFLLYLTHQHGFQLHGLLWAFMLNSLIFILPGLVWFSYIKREREDPIFSLASIYLFSFLHLVFSLALLIILKVEVNSFSFLSTILILTGLGLFKFKSYEIKIKNIKLILIIVFSTLIVVYYGVHRIPKNHLDDIFISTAYGLTHSFKPHSPIVSPPIYFAHPILSHYFSCFALVLTDQINFLSNLSDSKWGDLIASNPFLLFSLRTPYIFLTVLFNITLYILLTKLTNSNWLSLLGVALYQTLPEVFVRSSLPSYATITNLCLLLIAYFYIFYSGDKKFSTSFYLLGIFTLLFCHKSLFIIIPIFLHQLWRKKNILKIISTKIIIGFFIGLLLWTAYGLSISPKAFIHNFYRVHLIDRLLHIKGPRIYLPPHQIAEYKDKPEVKYPSPLQLWSEFSHSLGAPLLFLGVLSVLYLPIYKRKMEVKDKGENVDIFSFWFIVGALIFSMVDWRQTKHLMLITPPIVISLVILTVQKKYLRFITSSIICCIIMRNILFILKLVENFGYYQPSPSW